MNRTVLFALGWASFSVGLSACGPAAIDEEQPQGDAALLQSQAALGRPSCALGSRPYCGEETFALNLLDRLNAHRTARGVAPVEMEGSLSHYAFQWAIVMASRQQLMHSPLSYLHWTGPDGWSIFAAASENVGAVPASWGVDGLIWNFATSPSHNANMLYPWAQYVGIGVANHAGNVWVVMNFGQARNPGPGFWAPATFVDYCRALGSC